MPKNTKMHLNDELDRWRSCCERESIDQFLVTIQEEVTLKNDVVLRYVVSTLNIEH